MAHKEQIDFFNTVKTQLPIFFKDCDVLDIGSLDINGNNHYLFENYTYTGVDIGPGNNVNVISKGHEFKPNKKYDVVISSECFEHDFFYKETILNCIELTKSGGLFTFTCATTNRPEHGTAKSGKACDSPHSHLEWNDYYKNLTEDDIREILNFEDIFTEFKFSTNNLSHDLYFWGIKK